MHNLIKKHMKPGGLYQLAKTSPVKYFAVKDHLHDVFSNNVDHVGVDDVFMHLESFPMVGMLGFEVLRLKIMTAKGIVGYVFYQDKRLKFVRAKKQ